MSEKYCPNCEDYREIRTGNREETYSVRGRKITVPVSVEICMSCGEEVSNEELEREILDQVNAIYRKEKSLLSPAEIKDIRKRYTLSQKSFAALLGMSETTINRYEAGKLQDQTHDNTIRACLNPVFVRGLLDRSGDRLTEWQMERVKKALSPKETYSSSEPSAEDELENLDNWTPKSDEVTERTGFRRFDFKRYSAVVVFFCKKLGAVAQTKLNKLLFYADFLNYKTSSVSITGSEYRQIQYGPVPAQYRRNLQRMEDENLIDIVEECYKENTCLEIRPGENADQIEQTLDDREMAILDYVADTFRQTTAKHISECSHKESAWLNTEDRQLISYTEAMNLSLSFP